MYTTELDGMVRNEQYKDMIREARDAARVAEARPRTTGSAAKTVSLLPVLLVSLAIRLINLWTHLGHHS